MKKLTAILLALALAVALGASALAVEYTNSIVAKPAPQVVEREAPDGSTYCALVLDPEDEPEKVIVLTVDGEPFTIYDYVPMISEDAGPNQMEFCITSISEDALLPEIEEKLESANSQILSVQNMGELDEGMDEAIKAQIEAFYGDAEALDPTADLAISDVFNAEFVYNKETIAQVQEGQKIQFEFKPNFTKDDFFILLHNPEGTKWEVVTDYEWTDEGTLIVRVDKLSVFAILVEKPADLSVAPDAPVAP